MHWTKEDIKNANKVERLNVINGLTGVKPANLVGTVSNAGEENVAIFSSVVHLSSNPPLYGLIIRPTLDVPRNTYENIKETGVFTINHVRKENAENAHYTSAKFPKEVSEFERCGLNPEYKADFKAPFVKSSFVQLGMRFLEEIPIPLNGTILLIGEIEHIFVQDEVMDEKGQINLELADGVGISGLNSYYSLVKIAEFPYARVTEIPEFKNMKKQHLPKKKCLTCGFYFSWRKKWEKNWDEVKYCSERCRKNKNLEKA